jgi:cholesterol transport system auxiliary component
MKIILSLALGAILFTGCASKSNGEQNSFRLLESGITYKEDTKKHDLVMLVKKPLGVGYIYNKDLVYSDEEGIYKSYVKHSWDEPLYKQMENMLVLELNKTSIFKSVVSNGSLLKYDLVLESNIYDFYQIIDGDKSKVKVQINLNLLNQKTKNLVDSKTFIIEKELKAITPKEALEAYNEAFAEFINQAVSWLKEQKY